jgi:hypothetical protein
MKIEIASALRFHKTKLKLEAMFLDFREIVGSVPRLRKVRHVNTRLLMVSHVTAYKVPYHFYFLLLTFH